jgi:multicomponent Na+:H+ antiporter subunit D
VSEHLPVLIVTLPLAGAILVPLLGLFSPRSATAVTLTVLLSSLLAAIVALGAVLTGGSWHYELGGWPPPWGIVYVVDALGGAMAVLVAFMALLCAVHASKYFATRGMQGVLQQALHLLLAAGLLGIVLTGDVFNLYVFLEIAALAAYALLASAGRRASVAVFRYLLMGTIAGALYLLGIGFLYVLTGTLNMADLAVRLPKVEADGVVLVAVALVVIGLGVKAAIFPLHGWLPDVYAEGPPSVVAFVSSVLGKVSLYVLIRILLFVAPAPAVSGMLSVLAPVAVVGMLAGATMAILQPDVRRMLAYSSVSQVGYVVLGVGLGGVAGLTGALMHVAGHAVAKGCLFLAADNAILRTGSSRLSSWAGLSSRLPLTAAAIAVAALSMAGLPPTAGFFAKWYLVLAALQSGKWLYVVAIVASSLLSAVYVFRLLETVWLAPAVLETDASDEAPASMLAPVLVLAAAVLALGLFNQLVVGAVLTPALAPLDTLK